MVARKAGLEGLALAFDAPFRLVCHRIPERVLSLGGVPMPVCSRCAGLWVGFSLGALAAWPSFSMPTLRKVLLLAAALLAVELVTQDLGLHPILHATRFLTGFLLSAPLGGTLGALVTRELRDGVPAVEGGSPR